MPRNLELKCRIASAMIACECARALGAISQGILLQEDTYFRVPHGRMKIRRHSPGPVELITYERPDLSADRWSDYRKIDVTSSPGLQEALTQVLGIAAVVKKRRHLFLVQHARIHIDEVEGLGTFLEFEVTNEDPEIATRVMEELKQAFGLEEDDAIGGSYADLIAGTAG